MKKPRGFSPRGSAVCFARNAESLEAFLRVSRDYLFLLVVVEVYEVVAVARDADEEAAVVVRVGLGVAQRRFVDDVELDVVSAELEVGADEVLDAFDSLFAGEDGGQEALVEQRSAGFDLVHLAERLDDRGRAVAVCASCCSRATSSALLARPSLSSCRYLNSRLSRKNRTAPARQIQKGSMSHRIATNTHAATSTAANPAKMIRNHLYIQCSPAGKARCFTAISIP